MNNRNWIAVFLGLACLVLFVGVFSASGNWMNNNNKTNQNNGATPQQISQTIKNVDNNKAPDGTLSTEIDANKIVDQTSNMLNPNNQNSQSTQNGQNSNILSNVKMPNMNP